MGETGWAETVPGTGIRRDHKLACQSSKDRKPGRRCDCKWSWWTQRADGKRVRASMYGTLAEAKAEKQRLQVEARENAERLAHAPTTATLQEWAARVFQARQRTVKPMSMNSYDRAYRVDIHPILGRRYVDEITPVMVGDWLNALIEKYGNRDKCYKAYQVLRLILNEAFKQQVIPANPVMAIKYPKKTMKVGRRSRDRVLNDEQYQALLAACKTPRQRLLIRLATEAGLRSGELCGLQFGDLVTGEAPYLIVQRNVTEGEGR